MSPRSALLLLTLIPLALSACTTCQQQAPSMEVSMDPAEIGARLGRELADRLRFMSYRTQQESLSSSDFPSSHFTPLQMPVPASSIPQAAPQWPRQPQPNVFVPRGNCPYCRGNKGK